MCEFPSDLLLSQPYDAAGNDTALVALHVLGVVWCLLSLRVVSDAAEQAFESAAERVGLDATAAGIVLLPWSGLLAPVLICVVATVVGAGSDLGVGAVVGSLATELLLAIGAAALVSASASGALQLDRAAFRDVVPAALALALCGLFARDQQIELWEAGVLLGLWGAYVVVFAGAGVVEAARAALASASAPQRLSDNREMKSSADAEDPEEEEGEEEDAAEEDDDAFAWPQPPLARALHALRLPAIAASHFTISQRPQWAGVALLAFAGWTAGLAYCAVWWASTAAAATGWSPLALGAVLLGALPALSDVGAAMGVAQSGFGGMMLASAFGSALATATVPLPVAWLVHGEPTALGTADVHVDFWLLAAVVAGVAVLLSRPTGKLGGLAMIGAWVAGVVVMLVR